MSVIKINDGTVEHELENTFGNRFGVIRFNPTDVGLVKRYKQTMDTISNLDFNTESGTDEDKMDALNNLIIEQVSILLNHDVKDELFAVYQPCSIFADGDFYTEVLMQHIGTIIEKEMNVRLENKKAKIKKATAKYHN